MDFATLGIDLSARPRTTAACLLKWKAGRARVERFEVGCDDDRLVHLVRGAGLKKVAIDAPFGWPASFTRALTGYVATGRWSAPERAHVVLRDTDRHVLSRTGQRPLSVAADKLGHTAIRCAEILTRMSDPEPVDRTGRGRLAEVYPAAALRVWQLPFAGYKRGSTSASEVRADLVGRLQTRTTNWLDLDDIRATKAIASDHLIDALICAILAGALHRRLTEPIGIGQRAAASAEGWIHIPYRDSLEKLGRR